MSTEPALREKAMEALQLYILDTLNHINTVRKFCYGCSKWMLEKETELSLLRDIQERADKLNSNCWLGRDSKREELDKELAIVLKAALEGLEELTLFLDAVEKLAVTSQHVFMESGQFAQLFLGTSAESIKAVISAARLVCPLLLHFKRDCGVFFRPSLHNLPVFVVELDNYICIAEKICKTIEKGSTDDFKQKASINKYAHFSGDLSEDDIQSILGHIKQLSDIRMDQHFRMAYLFQKSISSYIVKFSERQPRMLQFLTEVEECAIQLDNMKQGAQISSVVGSSVGVIGGILSIVGLALVPVTAGASLALTMTGLGLGITTGVNSTVTSITEIAVNKTHQTKASELFQSFMQDVTSIQVCLAEVSDQREAELTQDNVQLLSGACTALTSALTSAGGVCRKIDYLVDRVSVVKLLKSEELITGTGKLVLKEGKALGNVPRVASEIPDIGQTAAKGSLALSKSARAGVFAVNALFIGLDIFFICKDSMGLAKGNKSEASQFIRARAALWRSELDAWQRIHDSLCTGILEYKRCQNVLELPPYPVRVISVLSDPVERRK